MLLPSNHATGPRTPRVASNPGVAAKAVPSAEVAMSIVIPTSGRVELVRETFDSVAAQTFRDFEIVVTDDSPNPEDRQAIHRLANEFEQDAQVPTRYVFTKPRLYQAANTNQGLKHARGRLVRVLHSDDLLSPHAIATEVQAFSADPNLEVLFEDILPFEGQIQWRGQANRMLVSPAHHLRTHLSFCTAVPSGLVFTSSALRNVGLMDERYRFMCDWDFFCRLLITQIERRRMVARVSTGLVGWRTHHKSITSTLWQNHFHEQEMLMREFWQSDRIARLQLFTEHEEQTFREAAIRYRYRRVQQDYRKLSLRQKVRSAPWHAKNVLGRQRTPRRIARNIDTTLRKAVASLARRKRATIGPSQHKPPTANSGPHPTAPTDKTDGLTIAPFYHSPILDEHTKNWILDFDNTLNLWPRQQELAATKLVRLFYPNINRMFERTLHEVLKYIAVGNDLQIVMVGNHHLQWFGLKALLSQLAPGQFTLVDQICQEHGQWRLHFRRTAPVAEHYRAPHTGWTFGLLTLGDKPERTLAYLDSIRQACDEPYEAIVVCPRELPFLTEREEVKQIVFDTHDDKGWITKKKNLICQAAKFSDILICHDRFTLSPTFCQSFESWGYSYGMAAPRITLPDGGRSVDWAVVSSQNRTWSSGGLLDYRSYTPYAYVPGGATLLRKAFWQQFPWDENLFWNEHEDVELCRRAQRAGEVLLLADGQLRSESDRWLDHNPPIPFCPEREFLFGHPVGEQNVEFL